MFFFGVMIALFLTEVGIRSYVNSNWLQGRRKKILGGRISLQNCHDSAGIFGLFQKDEKMGNYISIFALSGAFWEFFRALFQKGHALMKLGLSLMVGGGLSNCWERLSKGFVTDYICAENGSSKFGKTVFNLADIFIVTGGLFFAAGKLIGRIHKKK